MSEKNYKEVQYSKYCWICKHKNVNENEEPCETCLTEFVNENSKKPLYFEENK